MPLKYRSYLEVGGEPSDIVRVEAEQVGFAFSLMRREESHKYLQIGSIAKVLYSAIRQKRIKFYFNEDGATVGFVIWALLSQDVSIRVVEKKRFELHDSEWNEGNDLWIVEFVATNGSFPYMLRDLKDTLCKDHTNVKFLRRKNEKFYVRDISIKKLQRNVVPLG